MGRKPHGLLLLFEGLPATVIQSQVLARVEWIESNAIATFDIFAFAHSRSLYQTSAERLTALPVELRQKIKLFRSFKPALPGSRKLNRGRLRNCIGSWRAYDFIQARGDYAAAVAGPLAQAQNLPMIWDCRGDAEAEFLDRLGKQGKIGPIIRWRARSLMQDGCIAARTSTAASFVSQPLKKKWQSRLGTKAAYVIPCVADERVFFFDAGLRIATRRRLGYSPTDTVLVFSGSLNFYQGFDLLASWFKREAAKIPTLHLLVVTPSIEEARSLLSSADLSRIKVTSAPFADVNGYLNAADFGFMMRPQSETNQSAFPTKFAEYGLTGLPTIVGPTVPDCYDFARKAGNLMPLTAGGEEFLRPRPDRNAIMSRYVAGLTHTGCEQQIRDLYRGIIRTG